MDKEKLDALIADFDKKVPQIEEERNKLYELRKEFVEYFNKEKLASMTLEEYCGGLGTDIHNFNHGLWVDLRDLSMDLKREPDQSNRANIGGVALKDGKFKYDKAYGNEEEAFEQIKKSILDLYEAGENRKADLIKTTLSGRLKRKFLSTYFPNIYIGICNKKDLERYVKNLGLNFKDVADPGECLLRFKAQNSIMKNWTNDIFSYFLSDVINKELNISNVTVDIEDKNKLMESETISPISSYLQCIYFGTPGSGKSYKVDKEILGNVDKKHIFRTTFHPDTDYASFVGTYKPVMNDTHEIEYKFVPQVFVKAYVNAWNDKNHAYFLVIEEINRGNCAQIFGDLFQLLDRSKDGMSEYPIDADEDLCKYLEAELKGEGLDGIMNGKLCLPSNLSIIATMNTSDQSLFPMDSAFKRRWDWEFVPSCSDGNNDFNLMFGEKSYKWHDFLNVVNERIKSATDSEDKQLGAYFIKGDVNAKQFKSKIMFYLWSEICKEEYGTAHNFFRYKTEKEDKEFSFTDLYNGGAEDASILVKFMDYLGVPESTNFVEE